MNAKPTCRPTDVPNPTRRDCCLAVSAWVMGALAGCGGGDPADPQPTATPNVAPPAPPPPAAPAPAPLPAPAPSPAPAPAPSPVGVREPRFGQVTMLSPTLWRVWTMAEDGSDRRTVREFDRRIWRARWSPDGRRIAFWDQSVEDAYMHRLYVMDADGTNMRFLAWGDSMGGLNWHPGSRHLVYTRYTVVRPNPASTVTMTDGFFHVVDADTGASAFSASAGLSGVYTAGCACTASRVTAPFWRDATSVVYNAFEQVMYDPANPATLNASSFRVRSMPVPTLPAFDVPLSAIGRLGDDITSQDTLIQVRPAVGVLFKQVLPSGVQRMLLAPPSGGHRVVLADGASRFYGLSPDGTRCIWNERFHLWAGFDGISTATALGPYPLEGEDWYLAA